jgi:hypothetical protein
MARFGPGALACAVLLFAGCAAPPIVRSGPPQRRVVGRSEEPTAVAVRSKILARFAEPAGLPPPFDHMTAVELTPPRFGPDWLAGWVDPGGFLTEYRQLSDTERSNDVLVSDPTLDVYWRSEYATASGPVRFHCGFIIHFAPARALPDQDRAAAAAAGSVVEVYEMVPTVWVGERLGLQAHGIGFGRIHDIRFVEPTVKDRVDVLDLIDRILATRSLGERPIRRVGTGWLPRTARWPDRR